MTVSVSVELQRLPLLQRALVRVSKRVQESVNNTTRESAQTILDLAKESMTTPKSGRIYGDHQASAPGEAPAIETRDLYESGKIISQSTKTTYLYQVVFDSEHAKHMEFGTRNIEPRPFLSRAYRLANARIKSAYVQTTNGALNAG